MMFFFFLVHVRNVKMTNKTRGDSKLEPLENGDYFVNIVARSHGHFVKMYTAMMKAIQKIDFQDNSYDEYKCKYIFTMNKQEHSVEKHIKSIEDEQKKILNENVTYHFIT